MLRRLGRTVEMVRYPDEFHVMMETGRPDRRVDRLERIVDWFERYLLADRDEPLERVLVSLGQLCLHPLGHLLRARPRRGAAAVR